MRVFDRSPGFASQRSPLTIHEDVEHHNSIALVNAAVEEMDVKMAYPSESSVLCFHPGTISSRSCTG